MIVARIKVIVSSPTSFSHDFVVRVPITVRPGACGPVPPLTGCYHPHGKEREHNYRAYYGVYHRMIQLVRFGILYEQIAELKSLSLSI